jgi:hypothetical protein
MTRGRCVLLAVLGLLVFAPGAGAAAGVDFSTVEGQSFTGKVVDIAPCTLASATITWGDGTTSAGTSDGGTGIQGTHAYTEEGTYSGSVSYTYVVTRICLTGTQTTSFQATVQDAPPTAAGIDVNGTAGKSLTAVVAHISDTNPNASASDFSAQISWGDGTTSSGSVSAAGGGGFDVTGTHTYTTAGSYPVNTSITDIGGASTSATSMAQIAVAAAQPPRIVEAPVVSGAPHETDTLSTTTGFWSGSPTAYQYQWLRCAGPTVDSCVVVAGATASAYTLVHADVGSTMRARVRAQNAVGTSLPADSVPTAAVMPLVLTARFTIAPNSTCTGVRVTFDASATQTPNPPIERYRFTEHVNVFNIFDFRPFTTSPPADWVIADGSNPRATEVPTYDGQFIADVPFDHKLAIQSGTWIANERDVTLTVRDSAGASASYTSTLRFDPFLSDALQPFNSSRAKCPPVAHGVRGDLVVHDVHFRATNKALTARIRCPTVSDCVGSLQLDRAFSRRRRQVKPVVIGGSSLYVTGHHTATIIAKLTRAGRSLLSHGKPIAAIALLTTVSPTGRTIRQSLKVTLISKRNRR